MKINSKHLRVSKEFDDLLKDMAKKRLAVGRSPKTSRRLTLAITRHPLIKNIEEDIINTDLD